ncbi:hypothetical protein [Leptospira perdikensis]|uniref:Uncharacterized protein n=1 Tax=Leptospira perdikensis TaxID=2484948 RepID=A0A4R9JNG3_9LEPT|nr:hypothetical protein [Leptospira perdikensis]TGL45975.1 hypothetical protein EHQ49_00895 [Leptospira perdikensis]
MADILKMLTRASSTATARIKNKSALNPILWLIGIVTLPSFGLTVIINTLWLQIFFVCIGGLPILIAIFSYIYFMFTSPDYLRSEEFHIKKYATEMIGAKGQEFSANADHLVSIANPFLLEGETIENEESK